MEKTTYEPMNFKNMEQREKSRRDRRMPSHTKVQKQREVRTKAGFKFEQYDDKTFNNI